MWEVSTPLHKLEHNSCLSLKLNWKTCLNTQFSGLQYCGVHPWKPHHCYFFVYFFGWLECVDHSLANVAHLVFLKDVWIRSQRAAVASRCAINLATHLPNCHLSPYYCYYITGGKGRKKRESLTLNNCRKDTRSFFHFSLCNKILFKRYRSVFYRVSFDE